MLVDVEHKPPGASDARQSPWIGARTHAPAATLRLIALHHAGGNAAFYQPWVKQFQGLDWLEFMAVQLPGRGRRMNEPPMHDLPALLAAAEEGIAPLLDRPYVLFGFSMGAMLAFELTARRQRRGETLPQALVLAGRGAPRPVAPARSRATFSREKIVRELERLGGTDPVLLQDGPFMDILLRTFQADFALADAHCCPQPLALNCPLYAWGGADDPEVPVERIYRWNAFAGGSFAGRLFPGGHFFLRSAHAVVMESLMQILTTARRSR